MKRRPRRKRKALDIILVAICASSLAAAALIGWTILHDGTVYSEISTEAGAAEGGGIDWEALRARNPDISAWVSVEGTPIDYPVVSPREGDPQGFYLNHDFDRNWSFAGCPYLDPRGTADGRHALVYGHHLNFDSEMPGAPCASTRHSRCRSTRALQASRGSTSPAPPRRGHGSRTSRRRRARGRRGATTCARTPRAPSRS